MCNNLLPVSIKQRSSFPFCARPTSHFLFLVKQINHVIRNWVWQESLFRYHLTSSHILYSTSTAADDFQTNLGKKYVISLKMKVQLLKSVENIVAKVICCRCFASGKRLTLSLIRQFCSRRLWIYFVKKWKISIIEWIIVLRDFFFCHYVLNKSTAVLTASGLLEGWIFRRNGPTAPG